MDDQVNGELNDEEIAINDAMDLARRSGPRAQSYLLQTEAYRSAKQSGVQAADVERFIFEVTFELGRAGFLTVDDEEQPKT